MRVDGVRCAARWVLVPALSSVVFLAEPAASSRAASPIAINRPARDARVSLPLAFEANQGQSGPEVRFVARARGYTLFFEASETVVALREPAGVLRMRLVGARKPARVEGRDRLPGKSNYFIGSDPRRWRTGVPSYARVVRRGVYPGVDVLYYGTRGEVEQDFIVAPGADPEAIRLGFAGAERLEIDAGGDLVARLAGGREGIRLPRPRAYQEAGGARKEIAASYVLAGALEAAFRTQPHDPSRTLVIDPVLSYSTYLGGSGEDLGFDVAVDASGGIYLAGFTASSDFPTQSAVQPSFGGGTCFGAPCYDVFVARLDPTGSTLLYSTYLGGNDTDGGFAIALDGAGNAYVAGRAHSTNFPTRSAFQPSFGGGVTDAFVAKLDPAGELVYSTYLGGPSGDLALGIAVDSSGSAYVTGEAPAGFPTLNALQPAAAGITDVFITKLDPSGAALVYSTYLGGTGSDTGQGIAVDAAGGVYVAGGTNSSDFPLASPFQPTRAGRLDAFAARLDPSGSSLVYSTYLGGSLSETAGGGAALDAAGNLHLAGTTLSSDFPTTPAALQPTFGGGVCLFGDPCGDAFVAAFDPAGAPVYSTFLGGVESDRARGIAADAAGAVFVTGATDSFDFPIANAVQAVSGNATFFRSADSGASWSGVHGGLPNRRVGAVAVDPASPATAYCGTGEAFGAGGGGVFRSDDGGATWRAVNAGLTSLVVLSLAVDPAAPGTLYAGTRDGGVFRSADGGGSWTAANAGLTNLTVLSLAVEPRSSSTLYAGTQSGVFKSADAGASWTLSGFAGMTVLSLAADPVTPPVLYAGTQGSGVFKTLDGGLHWIPVSTGLTNLVVNALAVDPAFPLALYAGTPGGVFKSANGALTWSAASAGLTSLNVTSLAIDAAGGSIVYAGTFGSGVFRSADGAASWSAASAGLTNLSVLAVAADPARPGAVYAGAVGAGTDAYVVKLDASGASLDYATYLGGGSNESGIGVAAGPPGSVYVTGWTQSTNFPLAGALQPSYRGVADAFLVRIDE